MKGFLSTLKAALVEMLLPPKGGDDMDSLVWDWVIEP